MPGKQALLTLCEPTACCICHLPLSCSAAEQLSAAAGIAPVPTRCQVCRLLKRTEPSLYRLTGTGQLDAAYAVLETHGLHLFDTYRAQRHARLVANGRRGSIASLRKTTHLTANVPEGACYAR